MNAFIYDRLLDVPLYLLVAGLLEGLVLACAALMALAWLPTRVRTWYFGALRRWGTFAGLLLAFGCLGNSVFMLLTYQRLYVSADTVVDFYPFVPFGQWVLDATHGASQGRLLGGASLQHLQAIWAAVASAVWACTFAAYFKAVPNLERTTA